ncbi:MAG: CPBP family intramembrane metalloprotease [Asgard group archaeon]|nr:CPBP family intramembrane metalloprotease [Asgard group archaeon]
MSEILDEHSEENTEYQSEEKISEFTEIDSILRPKVQKIFKKSWILCIILYVLFLVIRGVGCLGPESIRILILVGFVLMWPLPFIFYSRDGWKALGIKKIEKPLWLIWGLLLGIGAAFLVYLIGWGIFGNTNEHWYSILLDQVISEEDRAGMQKAILFLIATGPAIVFSPVGEEFLFRGMIHEAFNGSTHKWRGGVINSLAFGLIHVFHYGVSYNSTTRLEFQPWTGLLWFVLMVGVSGLFTLCREKSKSIYPAIVSHSAFNLAMNASIFLLII